MKKNLVIWIASVLLAGMTLCGCGSRAAGEEAASEKETAAGSEAAAGGTAAAGETAAQEAADGDGSAGEEAASEKETAAGSEAAADEADPGQETASAEETSSADGAAPAGSAAAGEEGEVPILKDAVQQKMGCRIGAAATQFEMRDKKVWKIITKHFNAITFGNELKPDAMFGYSNGKCPGTQEAELNGETILVPKMDFSRAESMLDQVMGWNQNHPDEKIMVRGHVLVWHSQTPEWFFHVDYDKNKDYVDKDTMNKRLEWYIRTVLTHFTGEDSKYKGMFYGWDVVNEAVSDNTGTYRSDRENPDEPLSQDTHGSNSSWWKVYQSSEYILNAFLYANKYAPADLELYYNDYNECSFQKQQGILALLEAVKALEGAPGEGTRIDAMGMQGHYNMSSPSWNDFETSIERYAKVVGNVQITELDMRASEWYDGSEASRAEEYEKQAERYRMLYWAMQQANAKEGVNVTGITFWGTVDHYSWLQSRSNIGGGNTTGLTQCPLLFDDEYQPKPAFYQFIGE